jgi:hypothetical protein
VRGRAPATHRAALADRRHGRPQHVERHGLEVRAGHDALTALGAVEDEFEADLRAVDADETDVATVGLDDRPDPGECAVDVGSHSGRFYPLSGVPQEP